MDFSHQVLNVCRMKTGMPPTVQLVGWRLTKREASLSADCSILPGSKTKLGSAPVQREWSGDIFLLKPDGRRYWNWVNGKDMDAFVMLFGLNYFALMFCCLLAEILAQSS